jgi:hypothetical protein
VASSHPSAGLSVCWQIFLCSCSSSSSSSSSSYNILICRLLHLVLASSITSILSVCSAGSWYREGELEEGFRATRECTQVFCYGLHTCLRSALVFLELSCLNSEFCVIRLVPQQVSFSCTRCCDQGRKGSWETNHSHKLICSEGRFSVLITG